MSAAAAALSRCCAVATIAAAAAALSVASARLSQLKCPAGPRRNACATIALTTTTAATVAAATMAVLPVAKAEILRQRTETALVVAVGAVGAEVNRSKGGQAAQHEKRREGVWTHGVCMGSRRAELWLVATQLAVALRSLLFFI